MDENLIDRLAAALWMEYKRTEPLIPPSLSGKEFNQLGLPAQNVWKRLARMGLPAQNVWESLARKAIREIHLLEASQRGLNKDRQC